MKLMIKSILAFAVLLSVADSVQSQTITIPDTLKGWEQSWVANLNGSQASYNNWSQGGVSSISGTASSVYMLLYQEDLFSYGFRTNLKYGQSNVKGEGVRKTNDVISITNRFNYAFANHESWSGYANINFRTQFDKGYKYATEDGQPDVLISDFMAPGYLTEGAGIAYKPEGGSFVFEAGLGLKQTIVTDDSLAQNYGLEPDETIRSEGGLTTGITFEKEIFENIVYTSGVETFTNFLIPVDETDVIWSNELIGKINSIVSASFQFEMRYDNDFSSELQVKQVLSAGVSVNLY
ncbi:DUF3078 domain-containing protein [Gracilimonas mengyeensis]|uniref:DUF3078 domain-containing protein n=1 Tax=Gracilimonas mengyeensis TaxID=1302730 RepID=A0A521E1W6_9BACT|nr:DUF3078 domain-containing protein [Gracilimonas mengyeensis]SMO77938.1 Protein of unknown function [Gracilimonas mengyeensis]